MFLKTAFCNKKYIAEVLYSIKDNVPGLTQKDIKFLITFTFLEIKLTFIFRTVLHFANTNPWKIAQIGNIHCEYLQKLRIL